MLSFVVDARTSTRYYVLTPGSDIDIVVHMFYLLSILCSAQLTLILLFYSSSSAGHAISFLIIVRNQNGIDYTLMLFYTNREQFYLHMSCQTFVCKSILGLSSLCILYIFSRIVDDNTNYISFISLLDRFFLRLSIRDTLFHLFLSFIMKFLGLVLLTWTNSRRIFLEVFIMG